MTPRVSIVLATFRREELLCQALKDLLVLQGPGHEIVERTSFLSWLEHLELAYVLTEHASLAVPAVDLNFFRTFQ